MVNSLRSPREKNTVCLCETLNAPGDPEQSNKQEWTITGKHHGKNYKCLLIEKVFETQNLFT
jgi:hypothetical protein